MAQRVVIVDYGVGNLLSVGRAFEHCGATVVLADAVNCIAGAARLVLPGVGAFGDCISALRAKGLDQAVLEHAAIGRPLLGICVGMQMLFDASEEFGHQVGLGVIPGVVQAIPPTDSEGQRLKIPHIGWSALEMPDADPDRWRNSILADTLPGTAAYFVHSFSVRPADPRHLLADTDYGGFRIASVVRKGTVTGTQFHPEKSGPAGLAMIRNFLIEA